MKKIKFLILISMLIFTSFTSYSMESLDIEKKIETEPFNAENHFVFAAVNYFKGNYRQCLKSFVKAVTIDKSILEKDDYGMLEGLKSFVKDEVFKGNNVELKLQGIIFLEKIGYKDISVQELKRLLVKVKDSQTKNTIKRTLNNILFMSSL